MVSVLLAVPLIVSLAGPAGAASSATAASTAICASSSHSAPARRISRAVTAADETRLLWLLLDLPIAGDTGRTCPLGTLMTG